MDPRNSPAWGRWLDLKSSLALNPPNYFCQAGAAFICKICRGESRILFSTLLSTGLTSDASVFRNGCLALVRSRVIYCWFIYFSLVHWTANPSQERGPSHHAALVKMHHAPRQPGPSPINLAAASASLSSSLSLLFRAFFGTSGPALGVFGVCWGSPAGMEVAGLHRAAALPRYRLASERGFRGKLTADDYGKMFSKGETIYNN